MRTLFIFTEVPEESPKLAIIEGDWRHLNGIYVNNTDDVIKEEEVLQLFYEDGRRKDEMFTNMPYRIPSYFADFIIHCGFIM